MYGIDKEKQGVEEISRQTHVSKSTISKALNNCGSVDAGIKNAIIKTARELQYVPAQKLRMGQKSREWTIGVVIPINPHYFWENIIQGIKAAGQQYPNVRMVFSLFAGLSSEKDALYCLEYMQDLGVDLLVVTPSACTPIHEKLKEIAAAIPVVCLNETAEIPFLFYVGANFYRDGVRMARACAQSLREHPRVIQIDDIPLPMVSWRDEGFHQEMVALVPEAKWIGSVNISSLSASTVSAQLARILHEQYRDAFQSVYVSQGILPQVCLALSKLKLTEKAVVFGYENPKQNAGYIRSGMITAFLEQDTYQQGFCCMEAVCAYLTEGKLPEDRHIYVPSRLYAPDGEAEKNG